jgi:hypothetical protein
VREKPRNTTENNYKTYKKIVSTNLPDRGLGDLDDNIFFFGLVLCLRYYLHSSIARFEVRHSFSSPHHAHAARTTASFIYYSASTT